MTITRTIALLFLALSLTAKPHLMFPRGSSAKHGVASTSASADFGNGIQYHGGALLTGSPKVYVIWYGTHAPSTVAIVEKFLTNDGGSAGKRKAPK